MNFIFKRSIQACINAYDGEHGKVRGVFEKVIPFQKGHTQGHIGLIGRDLYIVFEGSDGDLDWKDNFKFWRSTTELRKGILVHKGFEDQFQTIKDTIMDLINRILDNPAQTDKQSIRIICTGHSLGGALATRMAFHIAYKFPVNPIICVTFGSPKVGNYAFAKQFNKEIRESYRFVYGLDTVCGVPPVFFGYWHVDKMIRLKMPWYDIVLFPIISCTTGMPSDHYPQLYQKEIDRQY